MSSLRTLARRALPILLTLGAAVSALPAQAGGVQWSVGIHLPMPGVVVYPAPPQVAYAPVPVYAQPRRVYMREPEVVYVQPREHRHWHHRRHEWREDYRGDYRQDGRHGR